ncbi:MAG: sel1 repeat family protein [Betaproteobacteria bacterium]|nr:sel1 repeat family protein [Betaproteobacteria bacterium]
MRRVFPILLIVAALMLPDPARAQQQTPLANPIVNAGAPWPFAGFVVDTPGLDDLYSQLRTGEAAAIGKQVVQPERTWAFVVLTLRPGRAFKSARELSEHMRTRRETGLDAKRLTKLAHEEVPTEHRGQPCSRYTIRAIDRGEKGDENVLMQFRGLTCVHPDQPDRLADVAYSERGGEGVMSEVLTKAGGRFLESLRFLPLTAPPELQAAMKREQAGDMAGSIALLKPLAEAGNTRAAAVVGTALLYGRGVPADPEEGRKWLEAAAKDGWVDVLFTLGVVYDKGLGVPRDPEAAVRWWTRAADQRDAQAQLNLGIYSWNAENAPRDVKSACAWWERAANNGNERALQYFKANRC